MSPKVTPLDQRIGRYVAELRKQHRASQPMVARVLGITYQSYQKIERGMVSIRVSTLVKLADYFGVPAGHIIDGALSD